MSAQAFNLDRWQLEHEGTTRVTHASLSPRIDCHHHHPPGHVGRLKVNVRSKAGVPIAYPGSLRLRIRSQVVTLDIL